MRKLLVVAALILAASTVTAQTADEIYAKGYKALYSYHFKDAMDYLWRYLNYDPAPPDLSNTAFRNSVTAAYKWAQSNYQQSLQKPAPSNDNDASVVSGLSSPPPQLRKPKAAMMQVHDFRSNLAGRWVLKIHHNDGNTYFCGLNIVQNGTNISGTLGIVSGTDMPIVGTLESGILTFACVSGQTTQSYTLSTEDWKNFTGSYVYTGDSPDFGSLTMARRPQ